MKAKLPLRSFRLQNFKAVRDSGKVAFGPLTVFIGNNGSGKSSLIEGLETFRDIVLEGLDKAMRRWRGFEHIWNHAVKHDLRQPADHRPQHTNPMAFRIALRFETYSVTAKDEINLGEGGNELYVQREQVIRKGQGTTERISRDARGKQVVAIDSPHRAFTVQPTRVSPQMEDGESILKDIVGHDLDAGSSSACHLMRWVNRFLSSGPAAGFALRKTGPTLLSTSMKSGRWTWRHLMESFNPCATFFRSPLTCSHARLGTGAGLLPQASGGNLRSA